MKALHLIAISVAGLAGCSWTTFSDLSDSTWVHAQEKPDSDQSDYGVGLVNAPSDGPGALAILSGSPPNYSVLTFDATGSTNETYTHALGNDSISALSTRPIIIGDGSGDVAVIDKSIDGPLVVVHGTATQLADQPLTSTNTADAAVFLASGNIAVFSAGTTPTGSTVFIVTATTADSCLVNDDAGTPLAAAAAASDGSTLWVYTRAGKLLGYNEQTIDTCMGNTTAVTPSKTIATNAPAANGGYVALAGTAPHLAAVVALDSASTTSGQAVIVNLDAGTAGTALPAAGVRAAAFATLGTTQALSLGIPGALSNEGQVDIHQVDADGTLHSDTVEQLSIPQADANLVFGRSLSTMTYNGSTILTVGASNVVYAYYQTSLYDNTRQQ